MSNRRLTLILFMFVLVLFGIMCHFLGFRGTMACLGTLRDENCKAVGQNDGDSQQQPPPDNSIPNDPDDDDEGDTVIV